MCWMYCVLRCPPPTCPALARSVLFVYSLMDWFKCEDINVSLYFVTWNR